MTIASCHRIGFGVPKDTVKARELELEAARLGSIFGQMAALINSLLDGIDLPIPTEEKVMWLKRTVSAICFQGKHESDTNAVRDRFRAAIDAVPDESLEVSLLHSFIGARMTEWEVLNEEFDGAADDPLFGFVVTGDLQGLTARLCSDKTLLDSRKDGFTLLHVATDYCHEHIIRGKVSDFSCC